MAKGPFKSWAGVGEKGSYFEATIVCLFHTALSYYMYCNLNKEQTAQFN